MGASTRIRAVTALCALAVALLSEPAAAEISFTEEAPSPYAVGTNPFGVVAADFNNDTRPDLAAVNGTSSSLSVFLRHPTSGFVQEGGSPFPVGGGPNYAAVADFNKDGLRDIATSDFAGNTVTVLVRHPTDGFVHEPPIGVPNNPSAIAAGDFNGDTWPDLAVARWSDGLITPLYRTPMGGFNVGAPIMAGANPRQIAVGNFNGDAISDIAVTLNGASPGRVTVILGSPGGLSSTSIAPLVGERPEGVVAHDFNGDGRSDLAVANNGTNNVTILLRNAANTNFDAGPVIPVGANPVGLALGDFDGDGRQDLATANNGEGSVRVLRRKEDGGFAPDPVVPIGLGSPPYGIAAGDFNGDSRADLAVTMNATGQLRVLLSTTGTPGSPPPPDQPPAAQQPSPPVARMSINPAPTCIGRSTAFDGSGSSSPNGSIVNYRFEYSERYYPSTVSTEEAIRNVVVSDGPNPIAYRSFDYNLVSSLGGTGRGGGGADSLRADPDIRAAAFVTRDPVDMKLTITDPSGAQASTTQRANFQIPCSLPLESPTVFQPLSAATSVVSATTAAKTLSVRTRCPGIVSCLGDASISTLGFNGKVVASRRKARSVTIAKGSLAVPAGKRQTAKLKVTSRGRRLLRSPGRRKVKITFRTKSPQGKTVSRSRNATLRVRKRG